MTSQSLHDLFDNLFFSVNYLNQEDKRSLRPLFFRMHNQLISGLCFGCRQDKKCNSFDTPVPNKFHVWLWAKL